MILEYLLVDVITSQIVTSALTDTDIDKFKLFMNSLDTLSFSASELSLLLKNEDADLHKKLQKLFDLLYSTEVSNDL